MTAKLTWPIWRNDRLPVLSILAAYRDGTPVDLTGATAPTFKMSAAGATAPKVDAAATVTDPAAGAIAYAWAAGDTDTPGIFAAQFSVLLAGKSLTFPGPDQFLEIVVREDL
jgi:hypothetical protein